MRRRWTDASRGLGQRRDRDPGMDRNRERTWPHGPRTKRAFGVCLAPPGRPGGIPLLPVETLDIGSGQTSEDYAAQLKARRNEVRNDARFAADLFFWAAGFAVLNSGLALVRVDLLVAVGVIVLAYIYG